MTILGVDFWWFLMIFVILTVFDIPDPVFEVKSAQNVVLDKKGAGMGVHFLHFTCKTESAKTWKCVKMTKTSIFDQKTLFFTHF